MHRMIRTEDGSSTLYVPELDEHYHSVHGAVREARHIFLEAGMDAQLAECTEGKLRIVEAGFGTGLNAWMTLLHAVEKGVSVEYHTVEKYPLGSEEAAGMKYAAEAGERERKWFEELHACPWGEATEVAPGFIVRKVLGDFREAELPEEADIVYYDAFSPEVQPHLWTEEVLGRFYEALRPGGMLVTYCVKGTVKRALRTLGFRIERLPGPPGKREMLRATK